MSRNSEIRKWYNETNPPPVIPPSAFFIFLKRVLPFFIGSVLSIACCFYSVLYLYSDPTGNLIYLIGLFGALVFSVFCVMRSGIKSTLLVFLLIHFLIEIFVFSFVMADLPYRKPERTTLDIYWAPVFAGTIFILQLFNISWNLLRKKKRERLVTKTLQLIIPIFYSCLLIVGITYCCIIISFIYSISHLHFSGFFFKWDC